MPVRKPFALAGALGIVWAAAAMAQTVPPGGGAATAPALNLAPIQVIGTTPLPSAAGIDRDKIPANVQTLDSPDLMRDGPAPLVSGLDRSLSSINLNDNEDNTYQPDVQYRGFTASPVLGTPTGLAVYQTACG